MKSLSECLLYAIVDIGYVAAADAENVTRTLLAGDVDIVQLRGKNVATSGLADLAARLHELTAPVNVPLIINDHPHVARLIGAEGVHLGQDDLPIAEARRIVGGECWVGKSTHNIEQAIAADREGADYVGFGPLFATPTKPDYTPVGLGSIRKVHEEVGVPVFCIGGVKLQNLCEIIGAGARRVVIVSGLLQAEDAANYARSAKQLLVAQP